MDDLYANCTTDCERRPECARCHRTKAPIGRSVPLAACGSYCDSDCPGYREEPTPGHLWPGELAEIRRIEAGEEP
jgi:hypothetical protein